MVYLVAPQVWAWRKGPVETACAGRSRRLLCIFPFEEEFFRARGDRRPPISAIRWPVWSAPRSSQDEFFRKHRLDAARPLIAVLPGSRRGESARHLPALLDAVDRIYREQAVNVVLPASVTTGAAFFQEPLGKLADSGDRRRKLGRHGALRPRARGQRNGHGGSRAAGHADGDLLSGDAADLPASGKLLVDVPFYSMVNLIAGRAVVPELIQDADDRREPGARSAAPADRCGRARAK